MLETGNLYWTLADPPTEHAKYYLSTMYTYNSLENKGNVLNRKEDAERKKSRLIPDAHNRGWRRKGKINLLCLLDSRTNRRSER
jgi:hypothetical protein